MYAKPKTIKDCENEEFARFDHGHLFKVGDSVLIDFTATAGEWSGVPIGYQGSIGTITRIHRTDAMGHRERPFLVEVAGAPGPWWLSKREIREFAKTQTSQTA